MTKRPGDASSNQSSQVRILSSIEFDDVIEKLDLRDREIGSELDRIVRNQGSLAKVNLSPINDLNGLRINPRFRFVWAILFPLRTAYKFFRKLGRHIRRLNGASRSPRAPGSQVVTIEQAAPLVSVLTPIYKPNFRHLKECLKSVGQDEELQHVLVIDGLENAGSLKKLKSLAEKYGALLVQQPRHGGISRATNYGAQNAAGEYLLFLDQDDYLDPMWFFEFKRSYSDADIVHSDTYVVTENRWVLGVFRKPEWSPVRLWGNMYCAHFFALKREIFEELGGLRPEFDGSQDHDLALRASSLNPRVAHIPFPLYSWRQSKTSTALDPANKPYAQTAGLATSQAHLDSEGIDAKAVATGYPGSYRIQFSPRTEPVSIVIPTAFAKDESGKVRLELAVMSLAHDLRHEDEIIVVCGDEPAAEFLGNLANSIPSKVTCLRDTRPFHFSRRANLGFAAASNDFVLLLNDDVYFTSKHVLDQLLGYARRASIGLVGALLWFPDGSVQHGGHAVQHGDVGHANFGQTSVGRGALSSLIVDREVSGVTGATIMQRKSIWEEVGGFSNLFPNNYNDVDYSFKVTMRGHSIIQANSVEGIHDESSTRNATVLRNEQSLLKRRWSWKMDTDSYS
jgi:GT2 family glycosyltransferase